QKVIVAQHVLSTAALYDRAKRPRLDHVSDRGRTDRTAWSDGPEAISRCWRWRHSEGSEPAGLNHICRDAPYRRGYQLRLRNLGFRKFSVNIYSNRVRSSRLPTFDLLADSHSDNVKVELVGDSSGRVCGPGAVGQEASSS